MILNSQPASIYKCWDYRYTLFCLSPSTASAVSAVFYSEKNWDPEKTLTCFVCPTQINKAGGRYTSRQAFCRSVPVQVPGGCFHSLAVHSHLPGAQSQLPCGMDLQSRLLLLKLPGPTPPPFSACFLVHKRSCALRGELELILMALSAHPFATPLLSNFIFEKSPS